MKAIKRLPSWLARLSRLRLILILLTAALAVLAAVAPPAGVMLDDVPDLVLYNGKITTVDAQDTEVNAVAIRDGVILATGANGPIKALAKKSTKVINLNGRRVLPGLIDSHLHGMRNAYHCFTQTVRLDLITSRAEALALYAAKASSLPPGRWIWTTSGGWNLNQLDNPTVFTFNELSAAAPNNPIWIQGSGVTGTRVNQAALNTLGLSAGSPGVVLDGSGKPTGQINAPATTAANQAIIAQLDSYTLEQRATCLADYMREVNRRGMTAWKDAGGNQAPWGNGSAEIGDRFNVREPTEYLYRSGGFTVRIAYHDMSKYLGFRQVLIDTRSRVGPLGDDWFRYMGPGEDMMPTDADYPDFTRYAVSKRFSVETHVGNLDLILNGFEAANGVYPISGLIWMIAHPNDGEPNDAQIKRSLPLGIGYNLTFSSVRNGQSGPRFRSTMESGVRMCLSSDAMNVSPYAPFQNLWYVTTGQTLIPGVSGVPVNQRLSRAEALRHATQKCAWFLGLDGKIGSVEPGNYADLIVLSKDYFSVPDAEIRSITSVITVVGGKIVYADAEYTGLDNP